MDEDLTSPEPLLPSIGDLSGIVDPAVKKALQAIKESLEIRLGQRPRSSFLDKAVTYRDLYRYNLATFVVNGQPVNNPSPDTSVVIPPPTASNPDGTPIDTSTPAALIGLIATGTKLAVILEWDEGVSRGYTEIHRSSIDDIGTAVLVGTTDASLYADIVGETDVTLFYWIRFVSTAGIVGAFNDIEGTEATTGQLGSDDLISVDGAKIIDATIINAKILSVSADKIKTGVLQASESIMVGDALNRIFIQGTGIIRTGGATDYAAGSGIWAGVTGGVTKVSVGNSEKYVRWDGANLFLEGNNFSLTDSDLFFNGRGTFNGDGVFSGDLLAVGGTFTGALLAATGSFSGNLNAATGSFAGTLEAGVLDFSKLAGTKSVYLTPGIYTITVPADQTTMRISFSGGGGGGGASGGNNNNMNGAGGGGGSSNMLVRTFTGLTPGATYRLTIGTGGIGANFGGEYGAAGGNGIASTLIRISTGEVMATSNGGLGGAGGGIFAAQNGAGGAGANGGGAGGVGSGYVPARLSPGVMGQSSSTIPAVPARRGLGGVSTNGGAFGGAGGEGAIDVNPPQNTGGYAAVVGLNGENGKAYIEFFNPNTVVIKTEYNTLLSALQRQGIAIV